MMMLARKYEFIVKPAVLESWSRNHSILDQGMASRRNYNTADESSEARELTEDETKFLYLLHFINDRLHFDQSSSSSTATSSSSSSSNSTLFTENYRPTRANSHYHTESDTISGPTHSKHIDTGSSTGNRMDPGRHQSAIYDMLMLKLLLASCLSLVTESSHSAAALHATNPDTDHTHTARNSDSDTHRLLTNTHSLLSRSQHQLCSQIMACCVTLLAQFPNDIKSLCSEYTLHGVSEIPYSPLINGRSQSSPTANSSASITAPVTTTLDKQHVISTLFQLQSVISMISHMASSCRPMVHPHSTTAATHSHSHSHHSPTHQRTTRPRILSNPQQPTVFPSLGLEAIFWFQQVQAELAPFQRLLAFSIRSATVAVSLGCR